MKDLLAFLIEGITGGTDFEIEEESENDGIHFTLKVDKDSIGRIIGKGGKTIKAIRNLLKVKATLEKKAVWVSVAEK